MNQTKLIGGVVLIIAFLLGLGFLSWIWRDYQALKTARKATEARQDTTDTISTAQVAAQGTVDTVRVVVEQARQQKDERYEKLLKTDKTVSDWDSQLIPDSVRNSDGDPINRPKDH